MNGNQVQKALRNWAEYQLCGASEPRTSPQELSAPISTGTKASELYADYRFIEKQLESYCIHRNDRWLLTEILKQRYYHQKLMASVVLDDLMQIKIILRFTNMLKTIKVSEPEATGNVNSC
jgi:hypothetical protein